MSSYSSNWIYFELLQLLFWNFGFESLNRQLHVPTFVSVFYVVFFLIFVMIKCKVYESLQKERKMIFKIFKPVNGVAIFLDTLFNYDIWWINHFLNKSCTSKWLTGLCYRLTSLNKSGVSAWVWGHGWTGWRSGGWGSSSTPSSLFCCVGLWLW